MLEIARVAPDGSAAENGLKAGDRILTINGEEAHDVIDYRFLIAEERVSLVIQRKDGKTRRRAFDKDPDDDLGLEFHLFRITRCRNRCIFCFVDQMPAGCRRSLYIKDDDFRASFLHGNYITLGALSEADWDRIFRQRLSPLYVSVHATDPELRSFILRNKKTPDILASLRRLADGGIKMHTQIVLCPGINDGHHLVRTIEDLAGLFPSVMSIAVVPVGITSKRKGLFPLRTFRTAEARAVIRSVESLGRTFKKQTGTSLVFASDEFYIKAGSPLPPASHYEEFSQIENGVGMTADFLQAASRLRLPAAVRTGAFTVVTGVSFSKILAPVLAKLTSAGGPTLRLVTAKNFFFGPTVTVAGLLTGSDILRALKNKRLGDAVIIPENAIKEDEDLFLDNMSIAELEHRLQAPVYRAGSMKSIVQILRTAGRKAL